MTTGNLTAFDKFLNHSKAQHQGGLKQFGKRYKKHSNSVLTSCFFSLIEHLSVMSSIEVGAFRAEFSRRFKRGRDNRFALAMEANPYNHAAFKTEVESDGVLYRHGAVLDVSGPATLQLSSSVHDENNGFIRGNNSIRTATGRTETRAVTVPGITLDSLVSAYVQSQEFPDPAVSKTVVWIDAEGALDLVIKGGQITIPECLALFTEVESEALWDGQSNFRQINTQLNEIGFFPFLRDCEYEPDQFNVIYINKQLRGNPLLTTIKAEFESALLTVPP